jgi:hypothetical protein
MSLDSMNSEGTPSKSSAPLLASGEEPPNLQRYVIVIILFLLLTGGSIWLIGFLQRKGLFSQWLNSAKPASLVVPVTYLIVEERNGVVLMLEQNGDSSRVIVKKSGQKAWLLISGDDTTAANPALSPDGVQVAYVSKRRGGQVVLASVMDNTPPVILENQVQMLSQSMNMNELRVCPWTPIAWSPKGDRIAFFVCSPDPPSSLIVISVVTIGNPTLNLVTGSEAKFANTRQFIWLDDMNIITTVPVTNSQFSTSVIELSVP